VIENYVQRRLLLIGTELAFAKSRQLARNRRGSRGRWRRAAQQQTTGNSSSRGRSAGEELAPIQVKALGSDFRGSNIVRFADQHNQALVNGVYSDAASGRKVTKYVRGVISFRLFPALACRPPGLPGPDRWSPARAGNAGCGCS